MKLRFGLYILVLAICVILILRHRSIQYKSETQLENYSVQSAIPILNTNLKKQGIQPSSQNFTTASTPSNAVRSNSQNRVEFFKKAFEQKNVPIDFYGQVIDQDSDALSGVKINVTIRHWELTETGTSKMIRLEKETNNNGRFQINEETGDGFDVEDIQKDGYEAEPGQRSFGAVGGSFENPVIFKMWSTNSHERLITGGKSFQIVPDGRPYCINLTDDTISESGTGDLKVWIKRPDQIIYGKRYDWSCEMDAINGGFLEEDNLNSAMYVAPANGYVSSFQFEQEVASGWGDSTGAKRFYIMLHDGQMYGRMSIELYAYYNNQIPGMIRLSYTINPSGSRILR